MNPILVTELGIVIEARFVPSNAASSIDVTEFGIVTDVSEVVVLNSSALIDVTPLGITTVVKLVPQKAARPIELTLLGMFIEVRFELPLNASSPIEVTELSIETAPLQSDPSVKTPETTV